MGRAEYFDPVSQSRKPIKSGSIVDNNGLEYTPEDVKEIDDKIGILSTEVESHKTDYVHHTGYGKAIGINDKTITLEPSPTEYKEGMGISFLNDIENTGEVTINVNGLGNKEIKTANGDFISSGDLKKDSIYTVRYNGINFILQGKGGVSKVAQINNLSAEVGFSEAGKIVLTWSNPDDENLKGLVIRYKAGEYPTSPTDGNHVLDTNDGEIPESVVLIDGSVKDGAKCFIRAFTYTYEGGKRVYTDILKGATITAIPVQLKGEVVFKSSSYFTVPSKVEFVDVFLVGGGGGGGGGTDYRGGGGGGGSTKTVLKHPVTPGARVYVAIGAGGNGGKSGNSSGRGGTSAFAGLTSGGGVSGGSYGSGGSGGSGGGGAASGDNVGGRGGSNGFNGDNGGGSGSSGGDGQGTTTREFATASGVLYSGGGGGGGGIRRSYGGSGGGGQGGTYAGGSSYATGTRGSVNSGGGGGGSGGVSSYHEGGDGGSGIVIVRWGY